MSDPKLHHYVPRFYLDRFTSPKNQLWVWDKNSEKAFQASSARMAAQTHFYRVSDLDRLGDDPLKIEKAFAELEGAVSAIMASFLERLEAMRPLDVLAVSDNERDWLSLFISLQYLRTSETRDILADLATERGFYSTSLSHEEKTRLHTTLLWKASIVGRIHQWIREGIWLFARNDSGYPFITSDNPVCFKTPQNRYWIKAMGIMQPGNYIVYPMSHRIMFYCKDRVEYWKPLEKFHDHLSPVQFNKGMVEVENSGQVFMASRFIFSPTNDFEFVRNCAVAQAAAAKEPDGTPPPWD